MEFGILGFGRFGNLLAGILRRFGQVYVHDEVNFRKAAEDMGVHFVSMEEAASREIVILCVPISRVEEVLQRIAGCLRPGAVVMDTCSVKEIPASWMEKYLPPAVDILPTHPLFGPDSAKNGLYGLQVVFCPVRIGPPRLQELRALFETVGLEVLVMTPSEHDRQSAASLCLVHYLGRTLAEMGVGPQQVTTVGFERLLRIYEMVMNDTWELFCDMQNYNPYAKEIRRSFREFSREIEERIQRKFI
jgi:prephenate dehydrogenase